MNKKLIFSTVFGILINPAMSMDVIDNDDNNSNVTNNIDNNYEKEDIKIEEQGTKNKLINKIKTIKIKEQNREHNLADIQADIQHIGEGSENYKKLKDYIEVIDHKNEVENNGNLNFELLFYNGSSFVNIRCANKEYTTINELIDGLKLAIKSCQGSVLYDYDVEEINNLKGHTINFVFDYSILDPDDSDISEENAKKILKKADELEQYINDMKQHNPNIPTFNLVCDIHHNKYIKFKDLCKKIREKYPNIENDIQDNNMQTQNVLNNS